MLEVELTQKNLGVAKSDDVQAPSLHLSRASSQRKEGSYGSAGVHFTRALVHPTSASQLSQEDREEAKGALVQMMRAETAYQATLADVRAERWSEAVKALEQFAREERSSPRLQLLEAWSNAKLGKWGGAQRAAARVVEATATYGTWQRGEPRMLAVALGTAAALELGDGKKALGFLSSVLKYDPDQSEVRKQYKALKEVLKLMEEAETQLVKGYNHKARPLLSSRLRSRMLTSDRRSWRSQVVKALDEVMAKLRGMDVASSLFRASILLKRCRARSSMNKHEQAMGDCQDAYAALSEPGPGVHVSSARLLEALEARAEAHQNDKNYDDAVSDLRAAIELAGQGNKAQELHQKLGQAQDLARRWKCIDPGDQKAWQDNRCGHPRSENGRDHRAVLELPANLDQLKPDAQCGWVTKQYRKLARVWHPDRYKGLKARAERKMRECAEAKEVLTRQLRC